MSKYPRRLTLTMTCEIDLAPDDRSYLDGHPDGTSPAKALVVTAVKALINEPLGFSDRLIDSATFSVSALARDAQGHTLAGYAADGDVD